MTCTSAEYFDRTGLAVETRDRIRCVHMFEPYAKTNTLRASAIETEFPAGFIDLGGGSSDRQPRAGSPPCPLCRRLYVRDNLVVKADVIVGRIAVPVLDSGPGMLVHLTRDIVGNGRSPIVLFPQR